jgi:hypothetical protein
MATATTAPTTTAEMMVNVFDGTRRPIATAKELLYRIIDGNQTSVVTKFAAQPSLFAQQLTFYDNPRDNYTAIVSLDGYCQAGFFPIKVSPSVLAVVDLMLLPKNSRFNFDRGAWNIIQNERPELFNLLSAGVAPNVAQARYEEVTSQRPKSLASFFNLTAAMEQIHLPTGGPMDYLKQLKWDESFAQDRFFAYADKELLNQVRVAAQHGVFAPEIGSGFFHPGATSSYKQIQFGEANVQLTFHEGDTTTIAGTDCVLVEPDIDYYKDPGAHALLEVLVNKVTGGLTDPRTVYSLRWIAGRRAGIPEFNPPYTIEAAT